MCTKQLMHMWPLSNQADYMTDYRAQLYKKPDKN